MQSERYASYTVTGKVFNVGPEEAVEVRVVLTAYDPLDRVVAVRQAARAQRHRAAAIQTSPRAGAGRRPVVRGSGGPGTTTATRPVGFVMSRDGTTQRRATVALLTAARRNG